MDKEKILYLKNAYPAGTKIKLLHMGPDPRPIADGTKGVVSIVDDIGTVHCHFQNGRQLGLIHGIDKFIKLSGLEGDEDA